MIFPDFDASSQFQGIRAQMKAEGANIVVALAHSGLTVVARHGIDENATYYLSKVPGIDAILFGHAHLVFPSDTYADMVESGQPVQVVSSLNFSRLLNDASSTLCIMASI